MRTSSKGFSIILLVIIIALVGVIGLITWRLLQPQPSPTVQSQNNQTEQPTEKNDSYLTVKEWGVQLPASNATKGMSYHFANGTNSYIRLSTPRLDELSKQNEACADAKSSVSMRRAQPGDDNLGTPLTEKDLADWVKIDNYYYHFSVAQPCFGASETVDKEIGDIRAALIDAIKAVRKAE